MPRKPKAPKIKQAEVTAAYYEHYVREKLKENPNLGTNQLKKGFKQENPNVKAVGNEKANKIINAVKGQERNEKKVHRGKMNEFQPMPTFNYEKENYKKKKPINPLTDHKYAWLVEYKVIKAGMKKSTKDYVWITSNEYRTDSWVIGKAKDAIVEGSKNDLDSKYNEVRQLLLSTIKISKDENGKPIRYINL